jgi:hypothetical protein
MLFWRLLWKRAIGSTWLWLLLGNSVLIEEMGELADYCLPAVILEVAKPLEGLGWLDIIVHPLLLYCICTVFLLFALLML